jgi:D-glycero-alpha-D-manno-heptose-7-phosphate kinase
MTAPVEVRQAQSGPPTGGAAPGVVRARTPLRISFAGGGTDVSPFPETEGGAVLSATIDRYVHGSLVTHAHSHVNIESRDYGITVQLAAGGAIEPDGNLDLVKAAVRRVWREEEQGYRITLSAGAPPGSGLGSSSALVVTVVALLNEYYGVAMGDYDVARLASVIEREDMHIAGGLQDYYAATFGGFNYIEFSEQVIVNPLRVREDVISELEMNLVLCFTGATRRSDSIISDQTERYTRSEAGALEGLRQQKDLATAMKAALLQGRLDDFGWLLGQAWEAKKKMSPKITTPLIDEMYDLAVRCGATGGKVTGAGGGGYMLLYVDFEHRHKVVEAMEGLGVAATGFSFAPQGARAWTR